MPTHSKFIEVLELFAETAPTVLHGGAYRIIDPTRKREQNDDYKSRHPARVQASDRLYRETHAAEIKERRKTHKIDLEKKRARSARYELRKKSTGRA